MATAVPALTRITPPTPAPIRAEPSITASTIPHTAIVLAARRPRTAGYSAAATAAKTSTASPDLSSLPIP